MVNMNIRSYHVQPALPERLSTLKELAYNLWWTWNSDAITLFQRLDPELWNITDHNPIRMLGMLTQYRLDELEQDDSFLSHMDRVYGDYLQYMGKTFWFEQLTEGEKPFNIAYFSLEFGLHESLPIYSGGLGVLAGDHLKSSSDLGIPLVAVGLAYQEGYFRQYLNLEGWQQETYPENDFYNMPMEVMKDDHEEQIVIDIDLPGRKVYARVWRIKVGRVPLYLLDTNITANSEADRGITSQLYGGDREMRIQQEILLGIGGIRALRAMGIKPEVCHMNEGHSAFLALERIRLMMVDNSLSFAEAREAVTAGNIFTTHTPVPAGIDIFSPELMNSYFHDYYPQLGLDNASFLALGRQNEMDQRQVFSMAVLALRLAAYCNGVSHLHAETSRKMWRSMWPGVPEHEIPIRGITNGVHVASWASNDMQGLLTRYLGPTWREGGDKARRVWHRVDSIPDSELWRTHERRRERLVAFSRSRLRQQLVKRGATRIEVAKADEVLDPEALTIGFARRFATYKRATILLQEPERLKKLLNDRDRPIQFIFAGKAHPHDREGKEFIKRLVQFSRQEDVRRHFVFIEDYDMNVARYLVQGVDVWLNNPRRPLEASGTSGMKVPVNGGLNLSVLDGWWAEGYSPEAGWAIGSGEIYEDQNYQDEVEGRAIYQLLEKELIPLYYDRGTGGLPRGWIAKMKASMRSLCPEYSTNRMVGDYTQEFYLHAFRSWDALLKDDAAPLKDLAAWKQNIGSAWTGIRVLDVKAEYPEPLKVGNRYKVLVTVDLAGLTPDDLRVQVYWGQIDAQGNMIRAEAVTLTHVSQLEASKHTFEAEVPCLTTGRHGYAIRILPRHPLLGDRFEPGQIIWA